MAEGAVSFYLEHFVCARVARCTYGVDSVIDYDESNSEHCKRSNCVYMMPSGCKVVPDSFSIILAKVIRCSSIFFTN